MTCMDAIMRRKVTSCFMQINQTAAYMNVLLHNVPGNFHLCVDFNQGDFWGCGRETWGQTRYFSAPKISSRTDFWPSGVKTSCPPHIPWTQLCALLWWHYPVFGHFLPLAAGLWQRQRNHCLSLRLWLLVGTGSLWWTGNVQEGRENVSDRHAPGCRWWWWWWGWWRW